MFNRFSGGPRRSNLPAPESDGTNAAAPLSAPVWRPMVSDPIFQEENRTGIRADLERVAEAGRMQRASDREAQRQAAAAAKAPKPNQWKPGVGTLQVKRGDTGAIEDHDPESLLDDPEAGPFAAEALFKRDLTGARKDLAQRRLKLRDPQDTRKLTPKERADIEMEGSQLQESDPEHVWRKQKLIDDDARQADEQGEYEAEKRVMEIEQAGPAGWLERRKAAFPVEQRRQEALATSAALDTEDAAHAQEESDLTAKLQAGVTAAEADGVQTRLAEVQSRRAQIQQQRKMPAQALQGIAEEAKRMVRGDQRPARGPEREKVLAGIGDYINTAGQATVMAMKKAGDNQPGESRGFEKAKDEGAHYGGIFVDGLKKLMTGDEFGSGLETKGVFDPVLEGSDMLQAYQKAEAEAAAAPGNNTLQLRRDALGDAVRFLQKQGIKDGREMTNAVLDAAKINVWAEQEDEVLRTLSDGTLAVSPALVSEKDGTVAFSKIDASSASPAEKARAKALLSQARQDFASKLSAQLIAHGEGDFAEHAKRMTAKGNTNPEEVLYSWSGLDGSGFVNKTSGVIRRSVMESMRGIESTLSGVMAAAEGKLAQGADAIGASPVGDFFREGVGRQAEEIRQNRLKSEYVDALDSARGVNQGALGVAADLGSTVGQMAPMFAAGPAGRLIATTAEGAGLAAATGVYGWAGIQGYSSIIETALQKAQEDMKGRYLTHDGKPIKGGELTPEEASKVVNDAFLPALANGVQTAVLSKIMGAGVERAALGGAGVGKLTVRDMLASIAKREPGKTLRAVLGELKPELKAMVKTIRKDMSDEAAEEGLNQLIEGLITQASVDPSKSAESIFRETVSGSLMGGVVGGGVPGVKSLVTRSGQTPNPNQGAAGALESPGTPATGSPPDAAMATAGAAAQPAPAGTAPAEPASVAPADLEAVHAEMVAADPTATLATDEEFAAAQDLAGSVSEVGHAKVAEAVGMVRELQTDEAAAQQGVATAQAQLTTAQATGDSKVIKATEAVVQHAIANVERVTRAKSIAKIARGAPLTALTSGELRSLGVTREGKPAPAADLEAVGITRPLVEMGDDGSPIILDEAARQIDPKYAASIGMRETEARAKATARAQAAEAAKEAAKSGTSSTPSGVEPTFTVTGRDGTEVQVQATDETAAATKAATSAEWPLGETVAEVTRQPQAKVEVKPSTTKPVADQKPPETSNKAADKKADSPPPKSPENTENQEVTPVSTRDSSVSEKTATGTEVTAPPEPAPSAPDRKAISTAVRKRVAKAKERFKDKIAITDSPNVMAEAREGQIFINPEVLAEEAAKAGFEPHRAEAWAGDVIDEEVRHYAQLQAARELWSEAGKPGEFEDWRAEHYGQMWREDFTDSQRDAAAALYGKSFTNKPDWQKAMETVRMISQQLAKGDPTEAHRLWTKLKREVQDAIRAALRVLKDMAGSLSATLKAEVDAIERVLAEVDAENADARIGTTIEYTKDGNRHHGTVLQVTPKGKMLVRAQTDSDRKHLVEPGDVIQPEAAPMPEPETPETPGNDSGTLADPLKLAGEPIGDGWYRFNEESGTLGIPRADMPQVKAGDRSALVQFLRARGIDYTEEEVLPGTLKPTQAEFNADKVDQARKFEGGDRAILVSEDGAVVDGHHQWLAKWFDAPGEPMRVIRLKAPIQEALVAVKEFPSAGVAPAAKLEVKPDDRGPGAARRKFRADLAARLKLLTEQGALTDSDKDLVAKILVTPDGSPDRHLDLRDAEMILDRAETVKPGKAPEKPKAEESHEPKTELRQDDFAKTKAIEAIDRDASRLMSYAQPTQGGTGMAVGANGTEYIIRADALFDMKRALDGGKTVEDAADIARASAREMVAKHNAKRPKDVNWQRWEGLADRDIMNVVRDSQEADTPPTEPEVQPETPRAEGEPIPAPAPAKKRAPRKPKGPAWLDLLENYFTPGKVLGKGERQDTVVTFNRLPEGKWSVTVRNAQGEQRSHSTAPSDKELDRAWKEKEPVTPTPTIDTPAEAAAEVKGESDQTLPPAAKGIEDFGEKIYGARKDLWGKFKSEIGRDLPEDGADITISKSFPDPDYETAIKAGVPVSSLAAYKAIRDSIPAKPRVPYKLSRWVEMVRGIHPFMQRLATGGDALTETETSTLAKLFRSGGPLGERIQLYTELDYPAFTKAGDWNLIHGVSSFYRDGVKLDNPEITTMGTFKGRMQADVSASGADAAARQEVIGKMRERIIREMIQPTGSTAKKAVDFAVYSDRFSKDVFVGKKATNGVVRLKTGFTTAKEARQYIADHQADLEEQWNGLKVDPDYRRQVNQPRQGPPRREGDASPELFHDTFGFRGVQFGNWVEGDRRQVDINEAFDAFMDLAEALGVPPKAVSLDGSLGLAFGARGTGGSRPAAAHYEPGEVVINLTKKSGPGSLAHEWFHAFDNYFARLDKTGESKAVPLDRFATSNLRAPVNMRPAVWEAFKAIRQVLDKGTFAERSKKLDDAKSKPYYGTTIEKAARGFERYVRDRLAGQEVSNDYLVNITKDFSPALPTDEEMEGGIRQAYDELFNRLDVRETDAGSALQAAPLRGDSPEWQAMTKEQRKAYLEARKGLRAAPLNEEDDNLARLKAEGRKQAPSDKDMAETQRQQAEFKDRGEVAGRPDLANPGSDEDSRAFINAMDENRKFIATAETRKQWEDESNRLLEDRKGFEEKFLTAAYDPANAQFLRPEDIVAAMKVASEKAKAAGNSAEDHAEAGIYVNGYRTMMANQARTLASGYDRYKSPEERARTYLAGTIYRVDPSKSAAITKRSKTPKEFREKMRSAIQERIEKIQEALKPLGVTLDEILGGRVQLALKDKKVMTDVQEKLSPAENAALKVMREGGTLADIKRVTGLKPEEAERLRKKVEDEIRANYRSKVKGGAKLEDLRDEIAALKAATLTDEEVEAELDRIIRQGFGIPEAIPVSRLPKRGKKKRPAGAVDWNRPEFSDGMKSFQFNASDKPRAMALYQALKEAVGAAGKINTLEGKQKVEAMKALADLNRVLGKYGTSAALLAEGYSASNYRFDITDINHVAAIARVIQAIDADFIDKGTEWYYAGILSGIQTMTVNALGGIHGVLDTTLGKATEMAVNFVLRDPASAQLGEAKYILPAMGPMLSRSWSNALAAWGTETPFFEEDVLGRAPDLKTLIEGRGMYRTGSIGGTKGRVIRTPMRILLATDDFVKTAIACAEVGAMAYRLAKQKGLKPGTPGFDSFMKGEVNLPGSQAWQMAAARAAERTFTNALPGQYDPITGEKVAIRGAGDLAGFAAGKLSELLTKDTGNVVGKTLQAILRVTFFPFQKTPFNIIRAGIRRTLNPVSLFDIAGLALYNHIKLQDGKFSFTNRGHSAEIVQRLSQQMQGGVLMLLLAAIGSGEGDDDDLKQGLLITGSRPLEESSKGEREHGYRTAPPYTISWPKRDGSRGSISYMRIEPLSTSLAATIDTMRELKYWTSGKKTGEQAANSMKNALIAQISDKTFARGFADAQKFITGKGDITRFVAGRMASGILPNFFRQPIRESDPYLREYPDNFVDAMKQELIPYGGPVKSDLYGQPIEKGGSATTRWIDIFDVQTIPKLARYDEMLDRYKKRHPADTEHKAPAGPEAAYRDPATKKDVKMNPAQAARFKEMAGKRTLALLRQQPFNYENPSEADMERFQKTVTQGRSEVKKMIIASPGFRTLK